VQLEFGYVISERHCINCQSPLNRLYVMTLKIFITF